jgi:predicted permease
VRSAAASIYPEVLAEFNCSRKNTFWNTLKLHVTNNWALASILGLLLHISLAMSWKSPKNLYRTIRLTQRAKSSCSLRHWAWVISDGPNLCIDHLRLCINQYRWLNNKFKISTIRNRYLSVLIIWLSRYLSENMVSQSYHSYLIRLSSQKVLKLL